MQKQSLEAKENRQAIELIGLYRALKDANGKAMSFQVIAKKLNQAGFLTRRGKTYTKGWVKQLYDRLP